MNWKSRISDVSVAEEKLLADFTRENMYRYLRSNSQIIELGEENITIPDFYWRFKGFQYAVYLDGSPHLSRVQQVKDAKIDLALIAKGVKVDRFPYRAPISPRELSKIVEHVKQVLNGKGYFEEV